jgi:ADP-heptose:LPS heptosyltransferase
LITLFALLTGIKRRVGYSVNPWLLHVPACDKQASSNIEINNRAFNAIAPSPLKVMEPAIFFAAHDVIKFNSLFQDSSEERLRIVLVTETSLGHPNAWFSDRFVSLSKQLITQHNAFIVLVGADSNRADIEALRDQIGFDSVSLAGHTSPRELAALMASSDFCISVDTGAMHIARSVKLPTVILGNAAQPITLWLPPADLGYIELIRKDHLPCSICWKLHCSTRECMDEISAQDVISAFSRLNDRIGWSITARQHRVHEHISLPLSNE